MTELSRQTSASRPVEVIRPRTWWEKHGRTSIVILSRLALLIALVVCWQLVSGPLIDPLFISKPTAIWHRLTQWADSGVLWTNSWITIKEILLGYVIGAAAGVVFGFVIAAQRLVYRVLDPFIMSLYSIPKVALAPLFIVWLGIGIEMKIVLAAVTVFFLVFLNTAAGVREVDPGLIDAARLMRARRRDMILKIILPASMSGVFTGLRVAIPYALIGAVIGELVASNRGLGYLINNGAATFDTAGVFAALIVLTFIAAVLNGLVNLLDRYANKWRPTAD
ncbi:MAG TPA: ABC transporter permease [Jatrophihabitantaceae bacterium]|jgi:NitT/TauT family transport system permease protein|nr:ABC transporter permease [Jatrophihabitantaceae bacterium]